MPIVDRRLYLTDDGELVEHGHPDAAFLWASEGTEVTEQEAERVGYKAAAAPDDKSADAPENKSAEPEPEEEPEAEFVCDVCGFEAKTAGGLGSHRRSHESD